MTGTSTPTFPLTLPPLIFIGGHPTTDDFRPGVADRLCITCGARDRFHARRCVPGMIVHLIDQAEIDDDPDRWTRSPWVAADALDAARAWWTDRAALILRCPPGHPRFKVCPRCSMSLMTDGTIPVTLPRPRRPVVTRR